MNMTGLRRRFPALLAALALFFTPLVAQAAPSGTVIVSLASDGTQGNSESFGTSLSWDGRYVAFTSFASNLASGDTNEDMDVFVRDQQTGQTRRVSVASDGSQLNMRNQTPSISGDGRYVAFTSRHSPRGGSGPEEVVFGGDILVHDRQSRQTVLVSAAPSGTPGNRASYLPSMSADGHHVAFVSDATNLVSGDTNNLSDIFVRDLQSQQMRRVSVASNGAQGNDDSDHAVISADGRFVAFDSHATNLVSLDTNENRDIFVHDGLSGQTSRVSTPSNGRQPNGISSSPCISADGRFVGFDSDASNLVSGDTNGHKDIFVHDRVDGKTIRVSVASDGTQANGISYFGCSISADGRYVAFQSDASNLVSGDTNNASDIFMRDLASGRTTRVSTGSGGRQANGGSYYAALSPDGSRAAFDSVANNLVSGDSNGVRDAFVHENGIFKSAGAHDGWVLESAESRGTGRTLDTSGVAFLVGDDAKDRQYRAVLSFDTSSLPDGAVITYAELRIKRAGLAGTNPFKTHGNLLVDMRKGPLGGSAALQALDFRAAASKLAAMTITNYPVNGWYSAAMGPSQLVYINKTGITQFRLRFAKGDNDNREADYLKFYSGDYSSAASRPVLIVEYEMP